MSTVKRAPLVYDKAMHQARKYWRNRLESMSFDTRLPLDHPRPTDGPRQLAMLELEFNEELSSLLQRVTNGNQFLVYTALSLALRICLYKYTGDPRVTVLSPGPSEGATADLLPISGTLDGDLSFKDALLVNKELLLTAFKNQQYPFSRMLFDLPDDVRPKHLSLVVSLVGFNEVVADMECDMLVVFNPIENNIKTTFRFDCRLYDESTIAHFFESFSGILQKGLGAMAMPVADLTPDDSESGDAASIWTTPELAEILKSTVSELIEAQSKDHPENVAIVDGNRITTYKMLNDLADQVAGTLKDLNGDRRKPIVILMDAGTQMIVSMLAVMKVGAAFSPIKLLSTRGQMVESLNALCGEYIICQPEHLAHLQQFQDSLRQIDHCITIELVETTDGQSSLEITPHRLTKTANKRVTDHELAGLENAVSDDRQFQVACVLTDNRDGAIATSSITHAELMSLFNWLNERCGISSHDRCLLSPGLGSCEQLYDTLGLLVAGASVEIPSAASIENTSSLAETLLDERITLWDLPTPLVQNLLPELKARLHSQKPAQGPRTILLSGEKQCIGLANKLTQHFPKAHIMGLYSPPAVGIWTTAFPLRRGLENSIGSLVAQSIPGFEHRVINKNGELAPFRAKGELQLTRLFAPTKQDLTAKSPPLKTGLRAAPLEGRAFSWLRSEDHCFTKYECDIELTQIEAILCQAEHILAAEVITVAGDRNGDNLVVAFLIADSDRMSPETVRDYLVLTGKVDFIPDRFVFVDQFPLTPEGEIDRSVLLSHFLSAPEPKTGTRNVEAEEIHTRLKHIWAEALQVDDVDEDESFFARGGNSLKATLLIARIRQEFSVDLSVQKFFRKPTTRAVAELIALEPKIAQDQQKDLDFKPVSREKYRVQASEIER